MGEDTSKSIKIKLSLNDLAPKTAEDFKHGIAATEIDKAISNLKLKSSFEKNQPLPIEPTVKNIQSDIQAEERPKISIKKPQLQDIKLKVNLTSEQKPPVEPIAEELAKPPTFTPAYARGNIPNQAESTATSPSLKIVEDIKGKTQKLIEPEVQRKAVIDLNSLNINLDKDTSKSDPKAENQHATPNKTLSNIDFETAVTNRKKNLSDTVKLKVRPPTEGGGKIFTNLTKEVVQEPPSLIPKVDGTRKEDSFTIPKNVLPNSSSNANKPKKKPNWIIMGILAVLLVLIVYFMITTLKTLAS